MARHPSTKTGPAKTEVGEVGRYFAGTNGQVTVFRFSVSKVYQSATIDGDHSISFSSAQPNGREGAFAVAEITKSEYEALNARKIERLKAQGLDLKIHSSPQNSWVLNGEEPPVADVTAAAPVEAYKTVLVAQTRLVIGGLPAASTAYTWALDLARKLKLPVEIQDLEGTALFVVDADHLKTVKARKVSKGPNDQGPRERAKHLVEALRLAERPEGVTRGELSPLTPGRTQPWTQILKNQAAKRGVTLEIVDLGKDSNRGGRVAYHL